MPHLWPKAVGNHIKNYKNNFSPVKGISLTACNQASAICKNRKKERERTRE